MTQVPFCPECESRDVDIVGCCDGVRLKKLLICIGCGFSDWWKGRVPDMDVEGDAGE